MLESKILNPESDVISKEKLSGKVFCGHKKWLMDFIYMPTQQ